MEGAAAIGAACVAYMGDFLFDEQEMLLKYWIQVTWSNYYFAIVF